MKRIKGEKGITLVALVITTIVLLILAGVVVKLSIGDNGVVSRTKDAANKYDASQSYEIGLFNDIANEYDQIIEGNWSIGGSGNNPGGGNQGGDNTNTTPGGDNPENPGGSGNLSGAENDKLEENGIKELAPNEITNENLKDNDNIKGVITGEVPIPVGGEYKEGTKETGVVVTMGESEFVWVPVENIEDMAVLQAGSTKNYKYVSYDFSGVTATKRTSATSYTEPNITGRDGSSSNLNIMNDILGTNYTAGSEFMMDLQNDFNEMVASVTKYKGFFVGRYEMSIDKAEKRAYSKANVIPATAAKTSANTWYGLYSYCKKMADTNNYTGVKTHMIWRSNYDIMLRWGLTGEDAIKVSYTGNAAHDLNAIYETGKETVLNKVDRINNVYDLEGNGREWTAEVYSTNIRIVRGGAYNSSLAPSGRYSDNYSPTKNGYPDEAYATNCTRPIVYIK